MQPVASLSVVRNQSEEQKPVPVLPGDRPRDRAERAVAVPAEHEPVFRHRHAEVAIAEVPHEHRARRWDASVPALGGARSLERIFGRSGNRSAGRQGLEVAREARLAAEVLRSPSGGS